MKITKRITINRSADDLWKLIAEDFDQAHLWMSPIPESYSIGKGKSSVGAPMEGRICHLSDNPDGAKAKEVITQYSDENKTLTFEVTPINNPAIVPLKKNIVQMSVREMGANQSEVVWVSQPHLKWFGYALYPLLRLAIPTAFSKLLQGLKEYAETTSLKAPTTSS